MNKASIIFLLSILPFCVNAQEVDYVIDDPSKTKVRKQNLPSLPDDNSIPNPDYTAYFLNATAYTLDHKKIRLSGTDVVFVKASYGLMDNFTASVNLSILGTFTGSLKQQFNLTDQVKAGISVSGGRLILLDSDLTQIDSTIYFGGGQAMLTLGDRQDNLTIGTGIYYVKSSFDFLGNGRESFTSNNVYVALQKQISRKLYLMAEGMYFLNTQIFTGAIGIKAIIGDRISLGAGVMPFGYNDPTANLVVEPIPIPLISFRYILGRDR